VALVVMALCSSGGLVARNSTWPHVGAVTDMKEVQSTY
jgi:hypothetical protein